MKLGFELIHDFGSKFNLHQNRHHLKAPFMLITMVQIPASYLIPSPRYMYMHLYSITRMILAAIEVGDIIIMWSRSCVKLT